MNVLICGATTYGNLGDDAIRDCMIDAINTSGALVNLKTTRPYPNQELLNWADKIIIGGGGLIYDAIFGEDDAHYSYFFKMYAQHAIENNKPLALIGCGTQGLTQLNNIKHFESIINYSSYITVRQKKDVEWFNKTYDYSPILADDLAFSFIPHINDDLGIQDKKNKPYLGLIPSRLQLNFEKNYIWLIETLSKHYEVFLFCSSYEDMPLINKLAPYLIENDSIRIFRYLTPGQLIFQLKAMDKIISARYHGLVFASNYSFLKNPDVYTLGSSLKNTNQLTKNGQLNPLFKEFDDSIVGSLALPSQMVLNENNAQLHKEIIKKFINE